MNNEEYRRLKEKGTEEFNNINHNNLLVTALKSEFPKIENFLIQDETYIKSYQLKQLSNLVDYAYLNIPLYREKYDKIGYEVGSIKTFDDFEKLPLLYKHELIDGFPEKIVKSIEDFKFSTRSSGSSGRFVTLAVDLKAIYTDTLQGIRQFQNQSGSKYKKEDIVLFIYTCPWWISDINGDYKLDFLPTTTLPKDAIEHIKKTKPAIISTYPTYLQSLCNYDINLSQYGVKLIIVHSEQSTKEFRAEMSKKLGVEVLDEYSSEELTRIALECPRHHYHIEEDACYIEIIDPVTKEKIKNGSGVVVGTNLLNYATPIIRYYQGDIVSLSNQRKCPCKNNGRIIESIQGREMDCIVSNEKLIPASSFMDLAYNWYLTYKIPIQGLKYQIIQEDKDNIKILLEKGLYKLAANDIEEIRKSLYTLVDDNIRIKVEFGNNFIMPSNKFKPVINLME